MSDIDTVAVDSLKALDPNRPIREADMRGQELLLCNVPLNALSPVANPCCNCIVSRRCSEPWGRQCDDAISPVSDLALKVTTIAGPNSVIQTSGESDFV